MKYFKISTVALLMLLVGVKIFAQDAVSYKLPKSDWLQLYKEFATYKCICEYSKEEITKMMKDAKDYSFVEHQKQLGMYAQHADSIGRAFFLKIEPMSTEKDDDLYGWSPFLIGCIEMNSSTYLDSVARKQYLLYLRPILSHKIKKKK